MADFLPDSDGFVAVTKKKSAKSRKLNHLQLDDSSSESLNVESCLRNINQAKSELEVSDFFKTFLSSVHKVLEQNHKEIKNIVCFGLGRISTCKIALHQLALLLLLTEKLNCPVEVFDPIFSSEEKDLLSTKLNLQLIKDNCEGRRKTNPTSTTLFILPHCPRELSNNLLYSNWDPLSLQNCVIYANSFENLRLNTPDRFLKSYHYLSKVREIVEEIVVPNTFRFQDVFNDLSLHFFPTHLLDKTLPEFWEDQPLPVYSPENELISN